MPGGRNDGLGGHLLLARCGSLQNQLRGGGDAVRGADAGAAEFLHPPVAPAGAALAGSPRVRWHDDGRRLTPRGGCPCGCGCWRPGRTPAGLGVAAAARGGCRAAKVRSMVLGRMRKPWRFSCIAETGKCAVVCFYSDVIEPTVRKCSGTNVIHGRSLFDMPVHCFCPWN